MKFPDALSSFLGKKEEQKNLFFSLFIDTDAVACAAWFVSAPGIPKIVSFAHGKVSQDSWEARTQVIDRLISACEEKAHVTADIQKTVFGMPGVYLTREGNIISTIRPHLKKLTTMLELSPVGFVPLAQALAYTYKKEEGIPASIILVGCSGTQGTLTVFRVGKLVGEEIIHIEDDPALAIENALKNYQDSDVLPSRILLYGGDEALLDIVKGKLLKHPWPTRANFLHFPKIESLSTEKLLEAVSLSGASELSADMGVFDEGDISAEAVSAVAQPTRAPSEVKVEDDGTLESEQVEPEYEGEEEEEESNIHVVSPEALGFERQDIVESPKAPPPPSLPRFSMDSIRAVISRVPKPKGIIVPIVACSIIIALVVGLGIYFIPHAVVTIIESPVSVSESSVVTVDPVATVADATTKTLPGHTQEKSITGEKTSTVTGKKKVGDPARGTVTIYNKVTQEKTFKKGSILQTKGLSFTLDDDVNIASASISISGDSLTFGKKIIAVTAVEIGADSNVPAQTEFTFKDVNSSIASARNDEVFSGGASRTVTVVTRADYDAMVQVLTDELVGKAKAELAGQIGAERLIEQTVKTTVSEKVFDQELDQEAKELHGKVTITVSGISISDEDVKALLTSLVSAKVPAGYVLSQSETEVTTSGIQVKKDGKLTLTATLKSVALPHIDTVGLLKQLAGQDVKSASVILKKTNGVAGAEFRFTLSLTQSRLPINANNITLMTSVQQ